MTDPAQDHIGLTDTFASRRYFRKFEGITAHLTRVAATMQAEGAMTKAASEVLGMFSTTGSFTMA